MNEQTLGLTSEKTIPLRSELALIEQKYFKPESADWTRLPVDTPPLSRERGNLIRGVVHQWFMSLAEEKNNNAQELLDRQGYIRLIGEDKNTGTKELQAYISRDGTESFHSISGSLIIELADYVSSKGIPLDQVELDSGFEEENAGFQVKALDHQQANIAKQAEEYLKSIGYQKSMVYGAFSTLNLAILTEVCKRYPGIYIDSQNQHGAFASPVPGVIFRRLSLGAPLDLGSEQSAISEAPHKGWDKHWGNTYVEEWKNILRSWVKEVSVQIPQDSIVLDLGSGMLPVTAEVPQQVVLVDEAVKDAASVVDLNNFTRVGVVWDINKNRLGTEFLATIAKAGIQNPDKQVGMVVMSDLLNYINNPDDLLAQIYTILNLGGKLVISNMPDQGYESLFAKDRPKNNPELVKLLLDAGFELEEVTSANNIAQDKEEKIGRYENAVIVARKQK